MEVNKLVHLQTRKKSSKRSFSKTVNHDNTSVFLNKESRDGNLKVTQNQCFMFNQIKWMFKNFISTKRDIQWELISRKSIYWFGKMINKLQSTISRMKLSKKF